MEGLMALGVMALAAIVGAIGFGLGSFSGHHGLRHEMVTCVHISQNLDRCYQYHILRKLEK